MLSGAICSSDSSTRMGSPADCGVAAASTNSHLGVITAVPKELSLGLTRCTLIESYFPRASTVDSESAFPSLNQLPELYLGMIADDEAGYPVPCPSYRLLL